MSKTLTTCADAGRSGGRKTSAAKTAANRRKAARFWAQVRKGERLPPRRHRKVVA
jgi:hypothetical protein